MLGIRRLGRWGCCLVAARLLCACQDDYSSLPVVGLGGAGPDFAPVVNPALWKWTECGRVAGPPPAGPPARGLLSVAVSPDGAHAVTTTGQSVLGWKLTEDLADSSIEWQVEVSSAYNARYSSDGTLIAISGTDPQLLTAQGAPAFRPPPLPTPSAVLPCGMQTLALSANGRWVAHSGQPAKITVFDLATFQQVAQLQVLDCIVAAAFSPDSQYLMTSVPELYETGEWTRLWPAQPASAGSQYIDGVVFAPLGRQAIVSSCALTLESVDHPFGCLHRLFSSGGLLKGQLAMPSAWPDFAANGDWVVAGNRSFYQQVEKLGPIGTDLISTTYAPNGDIIAGTADGSLVRLCRN